MPTWLEAVLLGIVQGLTEFIPVSSSGHLVLVPYIAGWDKRSLAFDVMLHFGTLSAVLVYFRVELWAIIRGVLGIDRSPRGRVHRRLGLLIVAANVPVAIVGLTLGDRVEAAFASPPFAAGMLLVTAGLLVAAEQLRDRRIGRTSASPVPALRVPDTASVSADTSAAAHPDTPAAWQGDWRGSRPDGDPERPVGGPDGSAQAGFPLGQDPADPAGTDLTGVSLRQVMTVGVLQCLALLPGVSRSGSTIAAGVGAGLTREAATRFSFLLVIPVLLGATVLSVGDLAASGDEPLTDIVLGTVAAGLSGYVAIRYLIALVARARLTGFAVYCVAASAAGFIAWATLGPISTV